jgi:acetylornithine/N-succinyldiaminopimelate aminotransferase
MALAKGLGGGFPVGACLAAGKAAGTLTPGSHGSTFGGNPLAMAVANAVLDVVLEDGFLEHVRTMGATLREKLTGLHGKYPQVLTEVRGIGLMLGLKCAIANTTLIRRLMDNGLLSVPAADNVVRLLPPLIVGEEEIDEALAIIDRSCAELAETAT